MLAVFLVLIGLAWLLFAFTALLNAQATKSMPPLGELAAPPAPPGVSVVVAARDEQARIEQAVRGLLRQTGVQLELIVVDDRSRDETPAILARLAKEFPQVRVVRIDELPPGWLGKCHACHTGASHAANDWIAFVDGDIHMAPDVLLRAVATVESEGADHLALWPAINCRGALPRACLLAWGQFLGLYMSPARVNRDRGKRGAGVGAFNLVRAAAYRAIGGHVSLRMEVVDDVKLGVLLRRAGFRQRLYFGLNDIEAEWAHTTVDVVRSVEKNWFAGMGYSLPKTLAVLVGMTVLWLGGAAGPVLDPVWGWVAFAGLLSPIVPAIFDARRLHWPWYLALLAPLGFVVFVVAGVNSTWKALRQGGIHWRDTFYPLAELRAGRVR